MQGSDHDNPETLGRKGQVDMGNEHRLFVARGSVSVGVLVCFMPLLYVAVLPGPRVCLACPLKIVAFLNEDCQE